jgi:CheY-like chemotaxis protein/HPt (histidine-containing phosphotransfer) domain-containing protein
MANETILVVDDAPVNLKLTDILLRKEGYKVHTTTDAEQALTLLRSVHPDLMLVDIQLPGMNGLDLTRRIKQDAHTRDIVVVALTACAMKGDDNKAFRAGCDGYITKPIETLTLAKRVREYLALRTKAPPPVEEAAEAPRTFPGGLTLAAPELESLRRRFLEEGVQQSRQLLENLDGHFDAAQAVRMAHGWVEAANVLDYPALAILAADAEDQLRAPEPDPLLLCDALSNVMVAFVEPPEASMGPVPDAISEVLADKSVALVGCAEEEAERLCAALERAGAKPRLFEAGSARDANAVTECSVVMVHVRPETLGTHWLHPLTAAQLQRPFILIGMRDHILELDRAVPARASEFLIDGWQPEEALLRIGHAMGRPVAVAAPGPVAANGRRSAAGFEGPREIDRDAEVLIADDDMTVRMIVRSAIQGAGIKCRMACDGTEALQMARDCRPPAAVLDVNMPGMDGYEVLAAIRNEALPVRVILLTARQQEADITRGFTLGADDYVVKPFNPAELLARLKRFLWQ